MPNDGEIAAESADLAYGGDRYALWVRITDVVHAGTAEPPEGDVDPCCRANAGTVPGR